MSENPTTVAEEYEHAERELITEFVAMFRFATSSGLSPIPDHVVQTMDELGRPDVRPSIVALVEGHRELARLVSPSTPRGLDMLVPTRGNRRKMPPIARRMMVVAALSLMTMLGVALRPEIGDSTGGIFDNYGFDLAIHLVFLLASAAVGASFHGLYMLSGYLTAATYDPVYDPSYWIRLFLGVLSGILLSTLEFGEAGLDEEMRSLLAIAGGFSTVLLYRVLNHLVSTFENLLAPSKSSSQSNGSSSPAPAVLPPAPALPAAERREAQAPE